MPASVKALPGAADAVAVVEEGGKPIDLKYMSRAAAAKALATRKAEVGAQYTCASACQQVHATGSRGPS